MMKRILTLFSASLLALTALSLLPQAAHAQDTEDSLKQSILQRVDQIDSLKLQGKVGENNVGLLEQRAGLSPAESQLMNAENSDRRALYTILAKRLGLTTTVVGQGRAEELRKRSASGVWLQDRGGNWYKK